MWRSEQAHLRALGGRAGEARGQGAEDKLADYKQDRKRLFDAAAELGAKTAGADAIEIDIPGAENTGAASSKPSARSAWDDLRTTPMADRVRYRSEIVTAFDASADGSHGPKKATDGWVAERRPGIEAVKDLLHPDQSIDAQKQAILDEQRRRAATTHD